MCNFPKKKKKKGRERERSTVLLKCSFPGGNLYFLAFLFLNPRVAKFKKKNNDKTKSQHLP